MMICFSIGSNLGDRLDYLRKAVDALKLIFGEPIMVSAVYETEGWGVDDHPLFLNAAISFDTNLLAEDILKIIQKIEKDFGRVRSLYIVEPRTIDIDILFFENWVLKTDDLVVPHPLISKRRFVLEPLAEIMGNFVHPSLKKNINELLESCEDKCRVVKTELNLIIE